MGFFKRNRQANERVQDLKNRVESLRKVDDGHRALTLDDFLGGDDAVTARSEPTSPKPAPAPAPSVADENALEAELHRYLQNHVESERLEETDPADQAPGPEPSSTSEAPAAMRPISIDAFPPLPPIEDTFTPVRDAFEPSRPPRLSADDEAALVAELQRYLKTEATEDNDAGPGEPVDSIEPGEEQNATTGAEEDAIEAPVNVVEFPVTQRPAAMLETPVPPSETPRIVERDGRSYEVPMPRHWPSVPSPSPDSEDESEQPPRRGSDWEPL